MKKFGMLKKVCESKTKLVESAAGQLISKLPPEEHSKLVPHVIGNDSQVDQVTSLAVAKEGLKGGKAVFGFDKEGKFKGVVVAGSTQKALADTLKGSVYFYVVGVDEAALKVVRARKERGEVSASGMPKNVESRVKYRASMSLASTYIASKAPEFIEKLLVALSHQAKDTNVIKAAMKGSWSAPELKTVSNLLYFAKKFFTSMNDIPSDAVNGFLRNWDPEKYLPKENSESWDEWEVRLQNEIQKRRDLPVHKAVKQAVDQYMARAVSGKEP